jgi:predicted DNA-binding transcriptional regulator AlpA
MATFRVVPKYVRSGAPLCQYLGLSPAAVTNIKQRPDFPKPFRKSQTLMYYRISDLDEWIESTETHTGRKLEETA